MRSLRTRRHDGQMVARENKCSNSIAYIIYPFVYDTYIFRLFVYYTDEEYSSAEYKLYPEIDGLYDIADHIIFFTLMFSIPYLFLSLKQIYKWINHITT